MKPIERPRSMTDEVAGRIRQAIVSGDLALGEELSERQLAQALGVSKTPVREALAQLRLEGLVRSSPYKGVSVFSLSAEEVREICELRQALEAAAMLFSMERHANALLTDLSAIVEQMTAARAAGEVKAYLAADTLFHLSFLEHCGNAHLLDTYKIHVGKIAALRTHLAPKPQHTEMSFREHRLILDMLSQGDVAGSLAILDQHIDRTKKTYASSIEDIAAADRLSADRILTIP